MDSAERLLKLLALLEGRIDWTAEELASRLAVTPRTVRRDVTRLRSLGYPVEAVAGPGGGYLMDHSRAAYLMGRNGEPIATLPVDASPEAVAAELEKWVS